jgi:hypothetical protein
MIPDTRFQILDGGCLAKLWLLPGKYKDRERVAYHVKKEALTALSLFEITTM